MYSINGVALDNPLLGWQMLAPSLPLSGLRQKRTSSVRAGRDGESVSPATRGPVSLKFTVRTPYANLGTLLALFSAPTLEVRELADPTKVAYAGLESSTPEQHYPRADLYSHSFVVEVHEGCWRGEQLTSPLAPASLVNATATVFPGLSAPVQDATVRLLGPLTNPQLVDSSGAFLAVEGSLEADQYLRFDSSSGRAWTTTTDTWDGGEEVSGLIDFGGPRGTFEITPHFPSPADPRTRNGQLMLSCDSFGAGSGYQIRGRPAYLL